MAGILDYYAQEVTPQFFEYYASIGLVDTMNILRDVNTSDGAGGQIVSTSETNDPLFPIPCRIDEAKKDGFKSIASDQLKSFAPTTIWFPRMHKDLMVTVKTGDRLQVLARETMPERLYRIITIKQRSAAFETYCEEEDPEA